MPKTTLYLFAISHYCEKARWALEYYGIPCQPRHVMPGLNRPIAKKLGLARGSVPFMQAGDTAIAGSGAILDWGEANRAAGRASLNGDDPEAVKAIEQRLDDVTGIHIRRYYYSDALLSAPKSVRPIFARDLTLLPKIALTLGWSRIVPVMIKMMDLGPQQGLESQHILLAELDWLDSLLADGRRYLTGGAFTRADITAASLLAPLVSPPEHPTYSGLALPADLAATVADWQHRPILLWVKRIYAERRQHL
jgi:glutathione S-transferase